VIAPELAQDPRLRARFVRESRLAASIDHPNVIPIYEAAELDGLLYIAARYVEGSDLRQLLAESGPLSPARAARLITQLAAGLDAAHARGLVHRDVKPANVLVAGGGDGLEHAYLTDFGLVKRTASGSGLTEAGAWAGTLDYVATGAALWPTSSREAEHGTRPASRSAGRLALSVPAVRPGNRRQRDPPGQRCRTVRLAVFEAALSPPTDCSSPFVVEPDGDNGGPWTERHTH
jgi:serine/threonine protein kinase